jgi:hypothetical protein
LPSTSPSAAAAPRKSRPSVGELRRLRTFEDVRAERERLYDKLDNATERLTGELVDRQIKILRMVQEDCSHEELRIRLDRLEESNRELAARLAGGTNGSAVVRADAAPAFLPENAGEPN